MRTFVFLFLLCTGMAIGEVATEEFVDNSSKVTLSSDKKVYFIFTYPRGIVEGNGIWQKDRKKSFVGSVRLKLYPKKWFHNGRNLKAKEPFEVSFDFHDTKAVPQSIANIKHRSGKIVSFPLSELNRVSHD